jgi:hypothetical protein
VKGNIEIACRERNLEWAQSSMLKLIRTGLMMETLPEEPL